MTNLTTLTADQAIELQSGELHEALKKALAVIGSDGDSGIYLEALRFSVQCFVELDVVITNAELCNEFRVDLAEGLCLIACNYSWSHDICHLRDANLAYDSKMYAPPICTLLDG